jgi:hypothetical protein
MFSEVGFSLDFFYSAMLQKCYSGGRDHIGTHPGFSHVILGVYVSGTVRDRYFEVSGYCWSGCLVEITICYIVKLCSQRKSTRGYAEKLGADTGRRSKKENIVGLGHWPIICSVNVCRIRAGHRALFTNRYTKSIQTFILVLPSICPCVIGSRCRCRCSRKPNWISPIMLQNVKFILLLKTNTSP